MIEIGPCQRLEGPCYEVTAGCSNLGGIYSPYGIYNNATWYIDDDGNEIYFNLNEWYLFDTNENDVYVSSTTDGSTVPLTGWVLNGSNDCDNFPSISVAEIDCPSLRPIPTLSQWGLILLCLCTLILGMVVINQRKLVLMIRLAK